MATMKEIAQLAGVSRGTVDRVINKRGAVSDETSQKILKIVESLNYTPNASARRLAAMKRNIRFLCIMPDPKAAPFFQTVMEHVEKKAAELQEYGITVDTLFFNYLDPDASLHQSTDPLSPLPSGIVVIGPSTRQTLELLKHAVQQNIPIVTANSDIKDIDRIAYVGSDTIKCGKAAAGLVRIMAHPGSRILVLDSSFHKDSSMQERSEAFFADMKKHSPHIQIKDILSGCDDSFESYSITKRYFEENSDIDIIYMNAPGVYGTCRALEMLPDAKRPRLICYDLTKDMEPMLEKGIITATICQQPAKQAVKPLDILFQYVVMGIEPEQEYFYTNTDIIIKETFI